MSKFDNVNKRLFIQALAQYFIFFMLQSWTVAKALVARPLPLAVMLRLRPPTPAEVRHLGVVLAEIDVFKMITEKGRIDKVLSAAFGRRNPNDEVEITFEGISSLIDFSGYVLAVCEGVALEMEQAPEKAASYADWEAILHKHVQGQVAARVGNYSNLQAPPA